MSEIIPEYVGAINQVWRIGPNGSMEPVRMRDCKVGDKIKVEGTPGEYIIARPPHQVGDGPDAGRWRADTVTPEEWAAVQAGEMTISAEDGPPRNY